MTEDVLIFAVLATAAVLGVTQVVRLMLASMQHKTIREALSRDNPAVPQMLSVLDQKPQPVGRSDDRTAFVLIAIAIALVGFGLIQGDLDDIRNLGGAALFPGLVGAALLLRYRFGQRGEDA